MYNSKIVTVGTTNRLQNTVPCCGPSPIVTCFPLSVQSHTHTFERFSHIQQLHATSSSSPSYAPVVVPRTVCRSCESRRGATATERSCHSTKITPTHQYHSLLITKSFINERRDEAKRKKSPLMIINTAVNHCRRKTSQLHHYDERHTSLYFYFILLLSMHFFSTAG